MVSDVIVRFPPITPPKGSKEKCGAFARSTGKPCKAKALRNGRCRNHGGLSTGARTPEGRKRISDAQKRRWAKWRAEKESNGGLYNSFADRAD